MSAILKALKKLEEETASAANLPLRREGNRHSFWRSKSIVIPVLTSVMIIILVVLGSMIVVRQHPPLKKENLAELHKTGPEKARQSSRAVKKKEQIQTEAVALLNNPLPAVQKPPSDSSVPTVSGTEKKDLDNQFINSDDAYAVSYPPEFASVEKIQKVQPKKNLQINKRVHAAAEPEVRILEDSDLKLQAISWSSDPSRRMAVINGKICREKDRVSGYIVKKISSGDVVLAKGAVVGKLVFKIR